MKNKKGMVLLSLFFLFLSLDFFFQGFSALSNALKWIFVCLVCLFAKDTPFFRPLFLTVFCDYFLLFTTNHSLGLAIFSLVHLLYADFWNKKRSGRKATSQNVFCFLLFFPILLSLPLPAVALVYIACFLYHITISIGAQASKTYLLGLTLFVLCDVFTLLSFVTSKSIFSSIIWLCYCPALVLMVFPIPLPLEQKFVRPLPKR